MNKQSWEEFKKLDLIPKQQNAVLEWHHSEQEKLIADIKLEKKSLLADLAYQGPDVPKKYREAILQFYKGYNKAIEDLEAKKQQLRSKYL